MNKLLNFIMRSSEISHYYLNVGSNDIKQALSNAFENSGSAIVISLIVLIAVIILVSRKSKKYSFQESLRKEINSYMIPQEKHVSSGNVSLSRNGVSYARGNRYADFDIAVSKETILAPFMVDDWFNNRNYNQREANMILSDISHFLTENKICKTVKIVSDEEYDNLISENESEDLNESENYKNYDDCDEE